MLGGTSRYLLCRFSRSGGWRRGSGPAAAARACRTSRAKAQVIVQPMQAELRDAIAANLGRFPRIEAPAGGLKPAAVALCVVIQDDLPALLITRRAPTLRNHAGQWALPGGRRDAGESAADAALRELREETGVGVSPDAVLGVFDDYVTRSGYLMTPVVVWGGPVSPDMNGPESEVAQIHVIPLADFD